jgi:hypothetical protein
MGKWKKSNVLNSAWSEALKCYVVLLEKSDGEKFVVRDFRLNEKYIQGEMHDFQNCDQIEDYSLKTGESVRMFTNEAKTSDSPTFVPKDAEPSSSTPKVETLTLAETISLAGAALNLKANPATTVSLDECTQAVLGYAIKLMNK